jgi:hypothetical protein
MTDLERAIKAELNRQSATAPSSASTEQFALSLIGPPDLSAATSRRHPGRRPIRDWLLSAIAVAVLGIPILTVAVIRSDRPSRDASQTPRVSTDPRDLFGVASNPRTADWDGHELRNRLALGTTYDRPWAAAGHTMWRCQACTVRE